MKLSVYFPDSWKDLHMKINVSLPRGEEELGRVWYEISDPREHSPGQVEILLEDEDD